MKQYPDRILHVEAPRKGHLIGWYKELQQKYGLTPAVRIDNPQAFVNQNHYKAGNLDIFFFANYSLTEAYTLDTEFNIDLRGRRMWLWDPMTGERALLPDTGTRLKLHLEPTESRLLVFDKPVRGAATATADARLEGPAERRALHWNVTLNHYDGTVAELETDRLFGFIRGGAGLNDEQKAELRKLNSEISLLELTFSQNLMHETNNTFVTVDKLEELEGLPEANIEAAAKMAEENGQKGKWMFNMQRPSCNPVLQYCKNRELRHRVYDAYYNRGNQNNQYDNKEISRKLVTLRLQKAKLMGYEDYASLALDNRMAKNEQNVYRLLDQVWTPAVEKAKEELNDIRAEIKKDGYNFEPEGWDYMYYLNKAKQAKYAIDEDKVSEYLEINNVLKGIFYVANKLYGLTFRECTDKFPVYEKTAQSWEVIDKDGKVLALFYSDYYPRDGKGAGAWCTGFRDQSYNGNERVLPVVVNVCNMTTASGDKPALQSIDNVTTMFHEFGHALHSFMCDVHYPGVSNVERDFVELPSQINEHWAFEPEVLNIYAKHYKTGEVIPMELVKKIEESAKYGQGFATVEYLAASLTDMDLHTLKEVPSDLNVMEFESQKLKERGIPSQIYPRYRVTNFSHTMGGGYTAGYYSYMWAEVLDCDAFQAFKETGDIFNKEMADKFRKYILTPGGIDDGMTMYKNFRGREPKIDALLKNRGLLKEEPQTLINGDIEKR